MLVGAAIGLLPAISTGRDWGAGLVMMIFGVVIAATIGGRLTGVLKARTRPRRRWYGVGFSARTGAPSDGAIRGSRWDR